MNPTSGHFSGQIARCEILRLHGKANVADLLAGWWLRQVQRVGWLSLFVLPVLSFAVQRALVHFGGYAVRAAWARGMGLSGAVMVCLLAGCTWRWRYYYKQARWHEAQAVQAGAAYTANAIEALVRLDPRALTARRANTQQGNERAK